MIRTRTKLLGNLSLELDKFQKEVQDKVSLAGVAAMAKVVYEEAQARAPISEKAHKFYGRNSRTTGVTYLFEPGNLRKAIYRVYSPEKSTDKRKTYRVTWNHQKAPYGFMVEFGTSRAPAHPFMRPAFDTSIRDAISEGKARMGEKLKEITVKS